MGKYSYKKKISLIIVMKARLTCIKIEKESIKNCLFKRPIIIDIKIKTDNL